MNNQLNGILLFWCPILNFPTFSHFFSFLNLSFASSRFSFFSHSLSFCYFCSTHSFSFSLSFLFFVVFSDLPSSSYSFRFPSLPLPSSSSSSPLLLPSSSLSVIVHSYYLAARTSCSVCNIYLQPHFPAYLALISSNTRRCLNHV